MINPFEVEFWKKMKHDRFYGHVSNFSGALYYACFLTEADRDKWLKEELTCPFEAHPKEALAAEDFSAMYLEGQTHTPIITYKDGYFITGLE